MSDDMFSYDQIETPGRFVQGTFAVMFIDIVQFTKFGDNSALKAAVRALDNSLNDVFAKLKWDTPSASHAVVIPTGDGYGVGFAPVVEDASILGYAAELSNQLKALSYPVRIGINKGPCFIYKDLNSHLNLTGWGIIDAERCMSCGEKNHILCSEAFADPYLLAKSDPNLHPVGFYKPKDRSLRLYNYYSDQFGEGSMPTNNKTTTPKKRKR